MPAPTYHVDDLSDSMTHIAETLETMAIYSAPCDPDTNDGETSQEAPETIPSVASRIRGTEEALAELVRVIFIHTNMLKELQGANTALAEKLKATTVKMDQIKVECRALHDAEDIDFMPKHSFDADESPFEGRYFCYPFVPDIIPRYDNSQWTDMSGLAATLAVAPQVPGNASSPSSRSSSSSYKERREEHVKRSRVTYDSNGGQTPNILPPDSIDQSKTRSIDGIVSSGEAECNGPAERSVSSWLYGKATKALFRQ
ncbi:hypothetical protein N0V82_010117 [Gnomoniopsis sp. IMI 355080]|nr:hypothetical protein N0V82_010117 [Gnomoniopsis sp. IMI 355080]